MDKKEALKILGLNKGATPEEISKRVSVLYKKFQRLEKDESGHTLNDVEEAYKLLSGITFRDKDDEKKRKYRQEHPHPLFKLLRVDEEKARNAIHYYKWHVLIGIAVLAIILSFVLTIVNRVEPQIRVLITGNVFLSDTELMEKRITKEIPEITEVQVQNVLLSESGDYQMQSAMEMKFFIEVSDGRNDIFILDYPTYEYLAKEGVFKDLEAYAGEWGIPQKVLDASQDLKMAKTLEDGNSYEPELYGLDVTGSQFLVDTGVSGERLILALGPGENPQNAEAFVKNLIRQGL